MLFSQNANVGIMLRVDVNLHLYV